MASAVPIAAKHRQIFEVMRSRISSGEYRPGDRIPTEATLLKEFGVSRPTVSRALQELRRRGLIQRRRGDGSYVSTRDTSAKLFGLLIPGLGVTEIFEAICGEMARVAHQDGHSLVWGATCAGGGPHLEADRSNVAWELCQRFIRDGVAGVFFAPVEFLPKRDLTNQRIIHALTQAKIPLVLLDRDFVRYPGRSEHDLVGINNRRVGHTIADHLFQAGAERLVFVMKPNSASTIHARAAGFAEAFITRRKVFDFEVIHECDPRDASYVRNILARHNPDGIVCGNDVTAGHLLHTLDELGVRVPADIMIGGVDGVKYAELLRVPLTTVRQPFAAIGEAAYQAMLDRIERPYSAARHITLGCELVVRDSTQRLTPATS